MFENNIQGLLDMSNTDPRHKNIWGFQGQWETIMKPYINSKMNSIQKLDTLLKTDVGPAFLEQGRELFFKEVYNKREIKNTYFGVAV